MIRKLIWLAFMVILLALASYGGNDKPRALVGEIADSQCALNVHSLTRSHQEMLKRKSMGGTSRNCTLYCIQYLGGEFVLSSKENVYRLDDQEKVHDFAGEKVKVTGILDPKNKTIHVSNIEAVITEGH